MGCDLEGLYTTASFLEKKTVVFSFVYPFGINSQWQIQFNPSLFVDACQQFDGTNSLPVYYGITYLQSLMPDGVAQVMTLVGAGANTLNQKNWECRFIPINAALGTFQIEVDFYQIEDYNGSVDTLLSDNLNKLIKNHISAGSGFTNTMPAVYNTNKVISGGLLVIDPTNLTEAGSFTRCTMTSCVNYTARYYDKGLYNGAAEFLNPTWNLTRTAGSVSNFSV